MGYKETRNEVDAEVLGCGILTCMCIVSLTILLRSSSLSYYLRLFSVSFIVFSYLIEGREVIQSTVIDATFCIVASALLMTAGGFCSYSYYYFNAVLCLKNAPQKSNFHQKKHP